MTIFSSRLRSLRSEKEKRQEDVAKILHVQRSTYGEYERGKIVPPIDKLKVLADYFGVSVDYLMGNTNTKTHEEREEESTIDIGYHLSIITDLLQSDDAVDLYGMHMSVESKKILLQSIENALFAINLIQVDT